MRGNAFVVRLEVRNGEQRRPRIAEESTYSRARGIERSSASTQLA